MSTSRVSVRAADGPGADEVITLTTPGGKPTSYMISASSITAKRVLRSGLHHHGAADGERRSDLADHVDQGEVVRRDAGHDADRLAVHHGADEAAGASGVAAGGRRGRGIDRSLDALRA
jgi:hypothetical protein